MVSGRQKSRSRTMHRRLAAANLVIFRRRARNAGLASLMLRHGPWDIEFDGSRDHEI